MPMATEAAQTNNVLKVTNEPRGPKKAGDRGSTGDQALMDAIGIIVACWVILLLLSFSLRKHNI